MAYSKFIKYIFIFMLVFACLPGFCEMKFYGTTVANYAKYTQEDLDNAKEYFSKYVSELSKNFEAKKEFRNKKLKAHYAVYIDSKGEYTEISLLSDSINKAYEEYIKEVILKTKPEPYPNLNVGETIYLGLIFKNTTKNFEYIDFTNMVKPHPLVDIGRKNVNPLYAPLIREPEAPNPVPEIINGVVFRELRDKEYTEEEIKVEKEYLSKYVPELSKNFEAKKEFKNKDLDATYTVCISNKGEIVKIRPYYLSGIQAVDLSTGETWNWSGGNPAYDKYVKDVILKTNLEPYPGLNDDEMVCATVCLKNALEDFKSVEFYNHKRTSIYIVKKIPLNSMYLTLAQKKLHWFSVLPYF